MMEHDTLTLFIKSLDESSPGESMSPYLKALWYEAKNNWESSHDLVQDIHDKDASWIHAYLHRKEGDIFNADYWYSKAGKTRPATSLQDEWKTLVNHFLK